MNFFSLNLVIFTQIVAYSLQVDDIVGIHSPMNNVSIISVLHYYLFIQLRFTFFGFFDNSTRRINIKYKENR